MKHPTLRRLTGFPASLRVREAAEGKESRLIEGYALLFGVRSRLLCDWADLFYEILEPGSVTREMLDTQDIKLTMFHDRQLILARSRNGEGTLSYEVDETGVKFWAEMPRTEDGDKALELIKRGDISGCSFCYSTNESEKDDAVSYELLEEETLEAGESVYLRHVHRIDNIYDFTVTPDPAYEQTSVSRREVEQNLKQESTDDQSRSEQEAESEEQETEKPTDDQSRSEQEEAKRETIRRIRERIRRKI